MRLKLGRPDIARFADRFDAPAAEPDALSVTWIGVATLLVDDPHGAVHVPGKVHEARQLQPGNARHEPAQQQQQPGHEKNAGVVV